MIFYFLIFLISILCLIHVLFNYNKRALLIRKIPGFKERFIVGNMLEIILSPEKLFDLGRKIAEENNGIYRFWCYPFAVVNIYNPEDIEIILSSMKYHEKSNIYKFLRPWLRDGLLLSKGKKWLERRKILSSAFHLNILRRYFVDLEDVANKLVKELRQVTERPVDVTPLMSKSTLNSICASAMGTQLSEVETANTYKDAIYELGRILFYRFVRIYLHPKVFFKLSSIGKRQKNYLSIIHGFTKKVINDRKKYIEECINADESTVSVGCAFVGSKKNTAMLDLLITAEKEGLIDSAGIQEEVDTFMFAGHDTTACALAYCLMLIAVHKEVQDKIVSELQEIFGGTERACSIEDLVEMRYLERCIKESLRLFPPAPFISRKISDAVKLSNYTVPAGTLCNIHIFDLHRREDIFPNALKFDPDRFLPENSIGRHSYAYIPFSAGPRNCMGQKFAMMQMKCIASAILRNFKLLPVTQCSDLRFTSDVILRNSGPILVKFVKREATI